MRIGQNDRDLLLHKSLQIKRPFVQIVEVVLTRSLNPALRPLPPDDGIDHDSSMIISLPSISGHKLYLVPVAEEGDNQMALDFESDELVMWSGLEFCNKARR